ncbi:unnamed protein product, partial [Ixodes hexagonus]
RRPSCVDDSGDDADEPPPVGRRSSRRSPRCTCRCCSELLDGLCLGCLNGPLAQTASRLQQQYPWQGQGEDPAAISAALTSERHPTRTTRPQPEMPAQQRSRLPSATSSSSTASSPADEESSSSALEAFERLSVSSSRRCSSPSPSLVQPPGAACEAPSGGGADGVPGGVPREQRRRRLPRITYSISQDSHLVGAGRERPIYPGLPFSPFSSPCSSPRLGRSIRESRRVSIEAHKGYTQLNQYRLKEEIGQGAFGIVKLAYSEEDDSHYAMKILSKKKLLKRAGMFGRLPPPRRGRSNSTTNPLDQVYHEIAVLKKLNHPNIVKLVEVLDDPDSDNLYMVFEFLEKGPVIEIPTKSPLTEAQAWTFFRDVVLGIEYPVKQSNQHYIITPQGVRLNGDEAARQIGAMMAKIFQKQRYTENADAVESNLVYTSIFCCAENRNQYSGKAVDVWAMGVTLFAFVVGNVPFHDPSVLILYNKIRNQPLVFPQSPQVSPQLQDLISGMLRKDPEERLTVPEIKAHPWITQGATCPMPSEEENCVFVEVTEEEIDNCVRTIPKLDTLILVKSMLKKHSFGNPFKDCPRHRARFTKADRSNSAPSSFDLLLERKVSIESPLPALNEINFLDQT